MDAAATGFIRGRPAVGLIAGDGLAETARSVLEHTAEDVPIMIAGGTDAGIGDRLRVRTDTLDEAADACHPADLVLVNAGTSVSRDWLDRLRDAAESDTLLATASAVVITAADQHQLDASAARAAAGSLRLRPRLGAPRGPCVYVRRAALELSGGLHGGLSDFGARCSLAGLTHALADDVLVAGPESEVEPSRSRSPEARARAAVRLTLRPLSVTIDCRHLTGTITGIQLHTLALIRALGDEECVRIRALVSSLVTAETRRLLDAVPGVEPIEYDALGPDTPVTDIAHRPYQVTNEDDLRVMYLTGERFVVTQQDLISYRNAGYFADRHSWNEYRQLTRRSLAAADRVIFLSRHAAADAAADDLVEPGVSRVVYNGVDHSPDEGAEPVKPDGAPEPGFLLCIGTDFRHKNRVFALRLLEELRRDHAFEGGLVFAGPAVRHGSSREEEQAFLADHSQLADAVTALGPVNESAKAWLFANAGAVAYPTMYEGFGLVPFEAAAAGVPCLFAAQAALAETLPPSTALLVPWNAAASASRAAEVLAEGPRREGFIDEVRDAGKRFTWKAAAQATLAVYREASTAPAREASSFARDAVALREERDHLDWELHTLRDAMGEEGRLLVGEGGLLPDDARRPLLAVAARPHLARPLFAALKALYRIGHRGGGT